MSELEKKNLDDKELEAVAGGSMKTGGDGSGRAAKFAASKVNAKAAASKGIAGALVSAIKQVFTKRKSE